MNDETEEIERPLTFAENLKCFVFWANNEEKVAASLMPEPTRISIDRDFARAAVKFIEDSDELLEACEFALKNLTLRYGEIADIGKIGLKLEKAIAKAKGDYNGSNKKD